MGCVRVSSQRGTIITGSRRVRWSSISNEALPAPMTMAARTYTSSGTCARNRSATSARERRCSDEPARSSPSPPR